MVRLAPAASLLADAVAQIGAACAALRRIGRFGAVRVSAAELVAACSGGWLLGMWPSAVGGRDVADQHKSASVTGRLDGSATPGDYVTIDN